MSNELEQAKAEVKAALFLRQYFKTEDIVLTRFIEGCEYHPIDILVLNQNKDIVAAYEVKLKDKSFGDVFCDKAKEDAARELGIYDRFGIFNFYKIDEHNPNELNGTFSITYPYRLQDNQKDFYWKWCPINNSDKINDKEWQEVASYAALYTFSTTNPTKQLPNYDFSKVNKGYRKDLSLYPANRYYEHTEWYKRKGAE